MFNIFFKSFQCWPHAIPISSFLGAFAKLRKAAVSFVMSVCPSLHSHGTIRFPLNGFAWYLKSEYFSKICLENTSLIKMWQEWPGFSMKTNVHLRSYIVQFLERKIFQTAVLEKIKTHILCSITFFIFFRKSCRLWDNVEKYCRAEQATDYNTAHAHSILDIWGYKHKLRISNTYCFSTATMVARMRLNVTLYEGSS